MAPDFICIGMQKAGTTWLYDQVRSHPLAWMPPLKEVMYWGGRRHIMRQRVAALSARDDLDERDRDFLRRAAGATTQTVAEYADLFQPANGLIAGDVSPLYAKLDEEEARALVEGLPDCRFLLLLREPGARVWSNANMAVRTGKRTPEILRNLSKFQRFANAPGRHDHNHASEVIRRWAALARDRFAVFVMDDLIADAPAYRRAVLAHIGLDGDLCTASANFDSKADEERLPMPEAFGAWLREAFADERMVLQELVGGTTLRWR